MLPYRRPKKIIIIIKNQLILNTDSFTTAPGLPKKLQLIDWLIKNFIFDLQVKESHEEGP